VHADGANILVLTFLHCRQIAVAGVVDEQIAEPWLLLSIEASSFLIGPVAELVGIEGGVVSGVINLELSGVEASDWRPRRDEQYCEA
jgi:hypothetical protein